MVASPNQTVPGQSIYNIWDKRIQTMGSGSDFTAFQDFAGIPSIDMGFGAGPKSAVYHYHSNYDSFDWMKKYGDTSFEYHAAIAKVWALVAARLIDLPILELNATDYALGLRKYVQAAKHTAQTSSPDSISPEIWEPLDEAVALRDYELTRILLEHSHQVVKSLIKAKKGSLLETLRSIDDVSFKVSRLNLTRSPFLHPPIHVHVIALLQQ